MNIVTFKNVGRLGNFLFQAAATMGYAWKHNLQFTVPSHTVKPQHNPIYLQHLVNPKFRASDPCAVITETRHSYQELHYNEEWRGKSNVVLHGYWQSEKYFLEYRDRVISSFGFPWKTMPGFVSVHVRRGDYLTLTEKHPPVPVEWIVKAMSCFSGFHFIFFSDDIPWCQRIFGWRKDVTFSTGRDVIQDLIVGSNCEHHICSASTFSWWQAYLDKNPNKRVIIPKRWFMPGRPEDTSDIVPSEWQKL